MVRGPDSRPESRRCICFDCDSTLSAIEGIDELAARAGRTADIVPLTTAAMEGRLAIEEVYGKRLEILRPSLEDLDWLAQRYVDTIVEGAKEAVSRLRAVGREVYIVSGGLKSPVLSLADALAIPAANVFAVAVLSDQAGRYIGYERDSPLTQSDGKGIICAQIAKSNGPVVLVGDGVTDVAARSSGAFVVGFGGVVRREAVVRSADHFIAGPSLLDVADYLLSAELHNT